MFGNSHDDFDAEEMASCLIAMVALADERAKGSTGGGWKILESGDAQFLVRHRESGVKFRVKVEVEK